MTIGPLRQVETCPVRQAVAHLGTKWVNSNGVAARPRGKSRDQSWSQVTPLMLVTRVNVRMPLPVGTPLAAPKPLFTKLDPSVVDSELARLGAP